MWQVPLLAAALALLGVGVVTALVTRPKPDVPAMLEKAGSAVAREDYTTALAYLNTTVRPYLDGGVLNAEQAREFHLLRARSVALGGRRLGVDDVKNAQTTVEEFLAARRHGATLESRDAVLLADAYVTLGRVDRAKELADGLPPEQREGRTRIVRRIVARALEEARGDADGTLRLLAEFLATAGLPAEDRAWALARQGELLVRKGLVEEAIAKLLQTMPGLVGAVAGERLGDLQWVLGRAYFEAGALGESTRMLESAAREFLESDPRWSAVQSLLGRIDELGADPQRARARYEQVLTRVIDPAGKLPPLLGLAEVQATLGEFEASLKSYELLLGMLSEGKRAEGVSPATVSRSLMERHRTRFSAGDTERALRYADLAERVMSGQTVPGEVLLALGSAHRRRAEELLGRVDGTERLRAMASLDPATREQARVHLVEAGRNFKRHADSLGALDNEAFGDSLWRSADSYDLAGDVELAIPLLSDFVRFFPGDARLAEARFRLGQAFQSRGDYATAAGQYRELLAAGGAGGRRGGSTAFADRAIVPLAQCLLMDGEAGNDAEAEQLLEGVVSGRSGVAGGADHRDALVELAGIRRRAGDWSAAIRHLEEAVQRFPEEPGRVAVRYELAEAYRRDAAAIRRTLQEAMPQQQRLELTRTRRERLARAMELYDQIRVELERRDERRLSRLERLQLRNSWFYVGDCAFDLGEFEESIRRYDAARERYPGEAASLVAMVQIVNAYVELGELERARTAQARAQRFYEGLPPTAWSDPDLPMDREDWQRWLDSMARLRPLETSEASAAGGGRSN